MTVDRFQREQGVALGPILFIIAILAVIAAAIAAGSGAFNANTGTESDKAMAEAIVQQVDTLDAAFQAVRSNGCSASQINFVNPTVSGYTNPNAPSDNSCNIFNPSGGSIQWQFPPSRALDAVNFGSYTGIGQWVYTDMCISGVSGAPWNCWQSPQYAQYDEIVMVLPFITLGVCQQLDKIYNFAYESSNSGNSGANQTAYYTGTWGGGSSVQANGNDSGALNGCLNQGNVNQYPGQNANWFYHVFVVQ